MDTRTVSSIYEPVGTEGLGPLCYTLVLFSPPVNKTKTGYVLQVVLVGVFDWFCSAAYIFIFWFSYYSFFWVLNDDDDDDADDDADAAVFPNTIRVNMTNVAMTIPSTITASTSLDDEIIPPIPVLTDCATTQHNNNARINLTLNCSSSCCSCCASCCASSCCRTILFFGFFLFSLSTSSFDVFFTKNWSPY